jgi:hypothetical protein
MPKQTDKYKIGLKLQITDELLVLAKDILARDNFPKTEADFFAPETVDGVFLIEDAVKLARSGGFFNFHHFLEVVKECTLKELEDNNAGRG